MTRMRRSKASSLKLNCAKWRKKNALNLMDDFVLGNSIRSFFMVRKKANEARIFETFSSRNINNFLNATNMPMQCVMSKDNWL